MTHITLPRATVEQALEALTAHADLLGTMYLRMDAITALRTALAQQAEPVALKHRHEWFSTGGMEPGQFRCIHCGVWAKETNHE